MSSEVEVWYSLLFHLMEYWERERKKHTVDCINRLESADVNDVETFVNLEYVRTLKPADRKDEEGKRTDRARSDWIVYSFPTSQSYDNSVATIKKDMQELSFLTSEGQKIKIKVAKEKEETPQGQRFTNLDKGKLCVQWNQDAKDSGVLPESIRTLTKDTYIPPRDKQSAFLGNATELMRINRELEDLEDQLREINSELARGDIEQDDYETKKEDIREKKQKRQEKRSEFELSLGFVDQFIANPKSRNVTFSLLRRDLPNPPLPKEWQAPSFIPEVEDLIEIASALDNSYLAIQGPPGTGKTWTGSRIIHHLVIKEKKKVGITSQAREGINNLLEATIKFTKEQGEDPALLHAQRWYEAPPLDGVTELSATGKPSDFIDVEQCLVASTTWFWAHEEFGDDEKKFDFLVIDEAGQLSLADALAASKGAKNVILLGDPQQLPQVSQASHPAGEDFDAGASIFEHIRGKEFLIPRDRGVLLSTTYRLDPKICKFISEEFYEGKLKSVYDRGLKSGLPPRQISDRENGLYWVSVPHDDEEPCVDQSPEEAKVIGEIIRDLCNGSNFINEGKERPVSITDFMVVAPYNRQRRKIRDVLQEMFPHEDIGSIVGTVDKFQGKEAPVVLYSMTTSSHEHVPKGREDFLFSPNRLNVAISRAQCMAFLVGSEALIDARSNSIPQMRALNHYCRYVDDLSRAWT